MLNQEVNTVSNLRQDVKLNLNEKDEALKNNPSAPSSDSTKQENSLAYKKAQVLIVTKAKTQFNLISLKYAVNMYNLLNKNNIKCSFNNVIDIYLFLNILIAHLRDQDGKFRNLNPVRINTEDFAKATFKFTRCRNRERPSETLMNYFRKILRLVCQITTKCQESTDTKTCWKHILEITPTRGHHLLVRFNKEFEKYANQHFKSTAKQKLMRITESTGECLSKCQKSKSDLASIAYLEKLFIACQIELLSNYLNDKDNSILEKKLVFDSNSEIIKTFKSRNVVDTCAKKLNRLEITDLIITKQAKELIDYKPENKKKTPREAFAHTLNFQMLKDLKKELKEFNNHRLQKQEDNQNEKIVNR